MKKTILSLIGIFSLLSTLMAQITIFTPTTFPIDITTTPVSFSVTVVDANGFVDASNEFQVFVNGVSYAVDLSVADVQPGPFGSAIIQQTFTIGVIGSGADILVSDSGLFGVTIAYQDGNNTTPLFNSEGSVVPVEMAHFDAKLLDKQVLLTWSTTTEINNEYFIVEKSMDGIHFEDVYEMHGAGTSNDLINYEYVDYLNTVSSQYFYRIKQIDYDGASSVSDIVTVKAPITSLEDSRAYYDGNNSIVLESIGIEDNELSIALINMSGATIFMKKQNVTQDRSRYSIPVDGHIAAGIYNLVITTPNGYLKSERVIIF